MIVQLVFSLEMICTSESLGPMAERPEALLCQFLIPLFLRAAVQGKGLFCLLICVNICYLRIRSTSIPSQGSEFLLDFASKCNLSSAGSKAKCGAGCQWKQLSYFTDSRSSLLSISSHKIISYADTAGRQGSVSVTDKGGYSATVSTTRIVRDSVVLAVMLGKFIPTVPVIQIF